MKILASAEVRGSGQAALGAAFSQACKEAGVKPGAYVCGRNEVRSDTHVGKVLDGVLQLRARTRHNITPEAKAKLLANLHRKPKAVTPPAAPADRKPAPTPPARGPAAPPTPPKSAPKPPPPKKSIWNENY